MAEGVWSQWDPDDPDNNNLPPPNGAPEGHLASDTNNIQRTAMQASAQLGRDFQAKDVAYSLPDGSDLQSSATFTNNGTMTGGAMNPSTQSGTTLSNCTIDSTCSVDSRGVFPVGTVIMWYGAIANVPAGWQICDGTNGTPDLTEQFVKGAANDGQVDNSQQGSSSTASAGAHDHSGNTGAHTLTVAEMPAHTHGPTTTYVQTAGIAGRIAWGGNNSASTFTTESEGGGGSHSHTVSSDGAHTHSGVDPLHKYIFFIMRV